MEEQKILIDESTQPIELDKDAVNNVADYLGSKPFTEVAPLISNLQRLVAAYSVNLALAKRCQQVQNGD